MSTIYRQLTSKTSVSSFEKNISKVRWGTAAQHNNTFIYSLADMQEAASLHVWTTAAQLFSLQIQYKRICCKRESRIRR